MSRPTDGATWSKDDLAADPHRAHDKAARVRVMFGAIAGRYDLNNRLHSLWRDQAWRRRAVRLCGVRPTDRVLDVACGTGDLTLAFACAGPAAVTGIDFTPEMIAFARDKTSARRLHVSPEFVLGDALNLPFEDRSFDVVSIAFGIRNVTDPRRALTEFARVLCPGGRLVILEFSEPRGRVLRRLHAVYTRHIMPMTATLVAGDRSGAYRYLPRSVETFLGPADLARLVAEAGFVDVHQHAMTCGVCVATVAAIPATAATPATPAIAATPASTDPRG